MKSKKFIGETSCIDFKFHCEIREGNDSSLNKSLQIYRESIESFFCVIFAADWDYKPEEVYEVGIGTDHDALTYIKKGDSIKVDICHLTP